MEYFCKDLSIGDLASASPSHRAKTSGEDGCPHIDWTAEADNGAIELVAAPPQDDTSNGF